MKISVIVPCYNYKDQIIKNLNLLDKILKKHFREYEIIVINDGSVDGTHRELGKLSNHKKLRIINNKSNKGKSYSIIKGLKKAKGKKIFLYDCDLPYFEYINIFLTKLKHNKFVIIDRKNKKSKLIKNKNIYQKLRHFIGIIISHFVCWSLKVEIVDTQSGMKGFDNLGILKSYKFISQKFFLDIEIINLFKQKNINPIKIPVKFEAPDSSTIKLFDIKNIKIINELIKVLFSLKN